MNKTNKTRDNEMKISEMPELLNGLENFLTRIGIDEDFKRDLLLKLNNFPVYFGFVCDLLSRKRIFSSEVGAEESKRIADYNISQVDSIIYGSVDNGTSKSYMEKFERGRSLARQSEI